MDASLRGSADNLRSRLRIQDNVNALCVLQHFFFEHFFELIRLSHSSSASHSMDDHF
jgi:hypothetical protein